MAPEPRSDERPAHILVVEDDVQIRALIADELRDAGFTVVEAADASEAWSYVESGAAVDLMFADVNLPGEINGLELARRLRRRDPATTIVLTSGRGGHQDARELGRFVLKPYGLSEMVRMIAESLGASRRDERG